MRPTPATPGRDRILVLKLGALGDFVQAFAGFEAIRTAHPDAELTLLTTPPFADLARASGLFHHIETDGRPASLADELKMLLRLRQRHYRRVYDLQTSSRSRLYFYAFLPNPPQWSGISRGASHPQRRPDRDALHNLDRIADQLHDAGIAPAYPPGEAPAPDLGWAARDPQGVLRRFGLARPFVLLAPGASQVKAEKFWPLERYAALARRLADAGLTVALVGGPAEVDACEGIARDAPGVVSLAGRTSLLDLAALGAQAALAVGNDSGPTHLMAYAGAPGLMLMSRATDPGHCAPRARMGWLKREDLADLPVDEVFDTLRPIILGATASPGQRP